MITTERENEPLFYWEAETPKKWTQEWREELERLEDTGAAIDRAIRETIYNELDRESYVHTCEYWDEIRYLADKGQQIHRYNQTAKGRPLKLGNNHNYAAFL